MYTLFNEKRNEALVKLETIANNYGLYVTQETVIHEKEFENTSDFMYVSNRPCGHHSGHHIRIMYYPGKGYYCREDGDTGWRTFSSIVKSMKKMK